MIGLDLSDKSVKIVELNGGASPSLKTLCWAPVESQLLSRGIVQDVALVTESVKQALGSCTAAPIEGRDVIASIPEIQSFVRVLEVPEMSAGEMDEAVQWAIRRHIPFDLDRVYVDWEALNLGGASQGNRQVLVGAAQKEVVDPLLSVLDNLGLHVIALELEAQAVMRCLLPRDTSKASEIRGVLVVDLGATSTNVILFDQGAMRFTTNVQYGGDHLSQQLAKELNITIDQAIELKERVGLGFDEGEENVASVMRNVTLNLIDMIKRAVQEMTVQLPPEQRVRVILLTGGGANLAGINDLFGNVFPGLPVQLGNPWTNLQRSEEKANINISVGDAMHFTTAIGLALREGDY